MERELLVQELKVAWVSDLKYVTTAALDHAIFHRLYGSGEQQDWYAYRKADDPHGLDIRVYVAHGTPLMALNEVIPQVTRWLQTHGIEALLTEIQVRSEQADNDEIKQLIEELRPQNYRHTAGHIGIMGRHLNPTC